MGPPEGKEGHKQKINFGLSGIFQNVNFFSFSAYPELVEVLWTCGSGLAVGTANHSRKFPPIVYQHSYEELLDKVSSLLKRDNLPISIFVDGITNKYLKRLPIGLRFINMNPESEDLVQCFYLAHPGNTDSTGEGTTDLIIETLKVLDLDLGQVLIGASIDGGMN